MQMPKQRGHSHMHKVLHSARTHTKALMCIQKTIHAHTHTGGIYSQTLMEALEADLKSRSGFSLHCSSSSVLTEPLLLSSLPLSLIFNCFSHHTTLPLVFTSPPLLSATQKTKWQTRRARQIYQNPHPAGHRHLSFAFFLSLSDSGSSHCMLSVFYSAKKKKKACTETKIWNNRPLKPEQSFVCSVTNAGDRKC